MPADDLRARLKSALTTAMKARERDAAAALRSVLGALDNAEAIAAPEPPVGGDSPIAGALTGLGAGEAARRELTDDDVALIVAAELADLRSSADEYERLGQADRAAGLQAGAVAVEAALRDH